MSEQNSSVHIETWEAMAETNLRITRANPDDLKVIPIKTHELDIIGDVVTGAQLQLGFEKIMLRQPRSGEGDMIFDVKELERYAASVWRSTQ